MNRPKLSVAPVALTAVLACVLGSGTWLATGHAVGLPVTPDRLSTFRPTDLPADCPQVVVVADADTWVNEQQPTSTFGTRVSLSVNARTGRRARTLLHFALPAVPPRCSLSSATLRVYNATATTTRTVAVVRADTTWSELGVTWDTQPAQTGTAVNATAAVGWMQWVVTNHVQALYSGTNTGFVLKDSLEDGANPSTQAFDSRDATNKPELVIQWG